MVIDDCAISKMIFMRQIGQTYHEVRPHLSTEYMYFRLITYILVLI